MTNEQILEFYEIHDITILEDCTLCPRECHINRLKQGVGYCGMDAGLNIASICIHRGEEPVISGEDGICNIFFSACNLRCIYCQNYSISQPNNLLRKEWSNLEMVLDKVEEILSKGIKSVGFVSPSHVVPQVKAIIRGLKNRSLNPVIVYNTNSYDKVDVIRSLDGLVDVYLADFKYFSPELALKYSDASNYPEVALKAIKEMYYQKGSTLNVGENGMAESGLMIRHLVLPGHVDESKNVLKYIAEELSPGIHISLMSQYYPTSAVEDHHILNRLLYREEYEDVVKTMEDLGFRNGWVQEMDSNRNYSPDFSKENPFE
jgi:putative pyruvate formate lyase activating enzyme